MKKVVSGQWSVGSRQYAVVSGRWSAINRSLVFLGLLLAVSGLLLAGCGDGADTSQPPEILYGQDVCDECNMIISEEKFASAYWTADGEPRRFDDLGEMMAYLGDHPDETIATAWVHDLNSAAWLAAGDAWYVMNSGLTTPMGTGIVALDSEEAANALAFGQDLAMVMRFDELLAKARAGELMNAHNMGE